tara:strand:- start:1416 stop:1655 length:240 start_codon:yes stop_codon:yes gene_type:complete
MELPNDVEEMSDDQIREQIKLAQTELDTLYSELSKREEKIIAEAQTRFQRARDELQKVYQDSSQSNSLRRVFHLMDTGY